MKRVQMTETILRDANQSLMATRLPYADYEGILSEMDKAGYYSVECWGGATFDACLRFLHEDPWQRLRTIREHVKNTKLQMLFRGQNILGYRHYADDVVEYFVQKSIANGIDIIRIFDALNDPRNLETSMRAIKKYAQEHGIEAYISLEERMACGIGACLGCICKTKEKDHHSNVNNARICKDGPVFFATEIDFNK